MRERSVIEVGALTGRFRDVARRVRFLVDQARAYADAVGGTLRDYLAWAEMQGAEGARVVEAVVPETDDDAVRIMTIHGAKGLEFPIVVCSGMTTAAQSASRGVEVLFPPAGGCEVKIVKGVQTAEFELHKPIDEQMGFHEKLRLLYVACTRARDHLVVSVHRKERKLPRTIDPRWTHAELLWEAAAGADWRRAAAAARRPGRRRSDRRRRRSHRPGSRPTTGRPSTTGRTARGNRRGFVSATTLAHRLEPLPDRAAADDPGLAKDGPRPRAAAVEQGPLRHRDRPGGARHAADGRPRDRRAASTRPRPRRPRPRACSGTRRRSRRWRAPRSRAPRCAARATRPYWRETYVAVPFEGITLEGYVDLVFRDDDGLVVVDYKTDAVDAATRAERVAHYRIQAAAYALAVAEATGEPVVRGVLCFLDPDGRDRGRVRRRRSRRPRWPRSGRCSRPSATTRRRRRRRSCRCRRLSRANRECGPAVCHPGRTREGPQVLPQVLGDGRRRRRRARGFAGPARPGGDPAHPRDDPDRPARAHDQRARRPGRSSTTATAT